MGSSFPPWESSLFLDTCLLQLVILKKKEFNFLMLFVTLLVHLPILSQQHKSHLTHLQQLVPYVLCNYLKHENKIHCLQNITKPRKTKSILLLLLKFMKLCFKCFPCSALSTQSDFNIFCPSLSSINQFKSLTLQLIDYVISPTLKISVFKNTSDL